MGSVWTAKKIVGRSNGVWVPSPNCARPSSRWPDTMWTTVQFTIWWTDYHIWTRSKILSNIIRRPRLSASVRHKKGLPYVIRFTSKEVTVSKETMDLYSHAGRANSSKRDSRYLPLCAKRNATSGQNLNKHLQKKKKKKPEIQIQTSKFDKISGAFKGNYIFRSQVAPSTKLYVPNDDFPTLLITLMFRSKRRLALT